MQSLFAQPISTLDKVSVGTVANTVTSLSNSIQQSISEKLAILFQSLALLITAYIIAFTHSWALTLTTSSAILFVLAVCSFTIPFITKIQKELDKADMKHSSIAAETFGAIQTIVSLGAEGSQSKKYLLWVEEARKQGQRMSVFFGTQLGLIFFAMISSFSLAFWFRLKLYREGHIKDVNTVIVWVLSFIVQFLLIIL